MPRAWWMLVSLITLFVGCGGQQTVVTVTGSSTVAPLMAAIAERYNAAHPEHRVEVQTGGSARGISDARRGRNDIGMVSRALHEDEADLHATTIAFDGLCLIVHADNPIAGLDADEVRAIYRGEVADWSRIGGRPGAISVVHKAAGRSTQELFLAHYDLAASAVEPDVVIGDNAHGIAQVAATPGAIGYVSIGAAVVARDEEGAAIRLLPMDGVPATLERVRDGSYPLRRELNLVTPGEPRGAARAVAAYASSPAVADLARALSLVPADG